MKSSSRNSVDRVVVVGAGGHSRVVISILESLGKYEIIGVADRYLDYFGEQILGYNIKYSWDALPVLLKEGVKFAVIAVGNNKERESLYNNLIEMGFLIPNIVHISSLLEQNVVLNNGNQICMGVIMSSSVTVGSNNIINTGSLLDHEVDVGNNVFIAPGCCIAGRVKIGDNVFIGIGVNIIENIKIGNNAVIGAGSVVLEDIPDNATFVGVPAKMIH